MKTRDDNGKKQGTLPGMDGRPAEAAESGGERSAPAGAADARQGGPERVRVGNPQEAPQYAFGVMTKPGKTPGQDDTAPADGEQVPAGPAPCDVHNAFSGPAQVIGESAVAAACADGMHHAQGPTGETESDPEASHSEIPAENTSAPPSAPHASSRAASRKTVTVQDGSESTLATISGKPVAGEAGASRIAPAGSSRADGEVTDIPKETDLKDSEAGNALSAEGKLAVLSNTAPAESAGAAPHPSMAKRLSEDKRNPEDFEHMTKEEKARCLRVVSILVATAFFMQMLDGTILNTALPSIAASLGESPLRMQSIVIAYLITVALLIPASGWLADRFGAKKTFFVSILIFCIGSLLCALSGSLMGLVAARVLQGIGGAIMVPVGRLVVLRIAPREDFVRVMSFITIPGLIGPLLGPALGGILVQYASWHWIFLINLPVGLVGCLMTLRYMPSLVQGRIGHFDWTGFLLFGFSMVAFSLGVEGAGELHLAKWMWSGLFAAGAVALLSYCLYALRAKQPLFPLGMFANRGFAAGIAGNFFARLGGGAMPFLLPLLLQLGLGFSPARAGLALIPMALGGMMVKPFVSPAVKRFGFRTVLVVNTLLQGIAIATLYFLSASPNLYVVLAHLTILGMINSMQFSVMNTVTLLELPPEQASAGNSILAVVTQLSISFGVSVGAAALGFFLGGTEVHQAPGWAIMPAFRYSFAIIGVWVMLSSIIFAFVPKASKDKLESPPARPH